MFFFFLALELLFLSGFWPRRRKLTAYLVYLIQEGGPYSVMWGCGLACAVLNFDLVVILKTYCTSQLLIFL